MKEKSFSERYFESLDKMEKTLAEAREVMRGADLVPLVLELKNDNDKIRERIIKAEKDIAGLKERIPKIKCPICKEAKEGCCCKCGKPIPAILQKLEPDPYAREINNDTKLHLECSECRKESVNEI